MRLISMSTKVFPKIFYKNKNIGNLKNNRFNDSNGFVCYKNGGPNVKSVFIDGKPSTLIKEAFKSFTNSNLQNMLNSSVESNFNNNNLISRTLLFSTVKEESECSNNYNTGMGFSQLNFKKCESHFI